MALPRNGEKLTMDSDRYLKICDVFAEARELNHAARESFLAAECGADADLRTEVESMLAADEKSGDFIEDSALKLAAEIMANEETDDKIGREIGHYKIVSPLGAGGMGEVWLAEDARLKRQIALKLLSAVQNKDFLVRFEQEAHAVSALNHPNIITIFDIGQTENYQFIATEYINGKTLRRLIKEGSLKIADAVEIAIQICSALVAAHSAGIVHRDIKPENIMMRGDGIVKILDFGLARFSLRNTSNPDAKYITKPGMIMGTIAYMSPEQARALPIEESTDIFSLGIVLYEMLSGKLPFEGVNEIETLAAILEREPQKLSDAIPDTLKEIIRKTLIKSPFERPTAEEILKDLRHIKRQIEHSDEIIHQYATDNLHELQTVQMPLATGESSLAATANRRAATSAKTLVRAARPKIFAAALVLLVAVFGLGFYSYRMKSAAPAVLGDADKLLIADFQNKTGDEEFDNILRQPLAVGLAQSPFFSLVSDGQIRQTLKQMEKPPNEILTAEIAGEIARRRGVKAFLTGAIENYGVRYLVTLEAFNSETGASVAREQIESANKETVIDSLNEATNEMREKLGESLASIKQYDAPLKTSTTNSLDALRAYSLATKSLSDGKTDEGITFLKQAADIDPNFAGAYASLAGAYNNKGQMSLAAEYAAKAFALRDRMTAREKQKITGFYYVFVTGELDKDIENLEAAKKIYPRDNVYPLNLGASYNELGKFAKAEENARQAVALDPTLFYAISNLGQYLTKQSRFDEAKTVYTDAANRNFDNTQINEGLFRIALAENDENAMNAQLKILEDKDKTQWLKLRANQIFFTGKINEYEKTIAQAVAADEKEMPDAAADTAVQTATRFAALGDCDKAESWANRALKLDRGQQILTDATLAFAVCGNAQTEADIAELKQRFPKNTVVNSIWLPIIRAALETNSAPDRALESLEINRQFEGAANFWDNYLRGKIYLKLNQTDQAETEFQKIVNNRGWAVSSPLYILANRELADIYKVKNDAENFDKFSAPFSDFRKNYGAKISTK